jgi:hypothetical protein
MDTPQPPQKSFFKSPYFYSGILFVVVLSYLTFIFISRYESRRALEQRNAEKAAERNHVEDRAVIEQLGGSELAVRALYVSPATIPRGGAAQLCYDVANAKTVALDPPVGQVWPSHSRCLDVSPRKTTTYTLTITDASGKSVSQSVRLQVR